MRVTDSATNENEDICIIADVYPNPFANEFTVLLEKKCLGSIYGGRRCHWSNGNRRASDQSK